MKKILSLVLFFFLLLQGSSQTPPPASIDVHLLKGFGNVEHSTQVFVDSTGTMPLRAVMNAPFIQMEAYARKEKISTKSFPSVFYLRLQLVNHSDSAVQLFFYPGKLYKKLTLFEAGSTPGLVPTGFIADGFVPIEIGAGQTKMFLVQGVFFKSSFNRIDAQLIAAKHLQLFKNELFGTMNHKKTAGIILSGMLLMMILVTLLNYFITKKIEFLYNSVYSLCMFLIIFLSSYLTMNPSWFKGFFMSYLDLLLLIIGTVSYLAFTRHFLNTKELHPKLNRFLQIEARVLIVMMIVYTAIYFGLDSYQFEPMLENMMKFVLLIAALVFIFLALIQKNTLLNYLAVGAATQIFFSIVSLGFVLSKSEATYIYTSPIFYFELGIICSIIFFLLGLFYKNRQELILKIKEQEAMKLEVEKQSFENRLTIYKTQQEERNRISADMHDDLGAGMTSIRLYSELAKTKLGGNAIPEIEKISSFADDLINKMNAIIWSMSSQNDSLGNMVAYIRSYTIDYLDGTGIKPRISIPTDLPEIMVNGTIRRNIFLVIKEALQNIVKHSKATEVVITMLKHPEGLSLTIYDNGIGIDLQNLRQFSNGLKNMKKRMDDVGIEFSIEKSAGTAIRLYGRTRPNP